MNMEVVHDTCNVMVIKHVFKSISRKLLRICNNCGSRNGLAIEILWASGAANRG